MPGEQAYDCEAHIHQGTGCKFGGCVRKAVELTSNQLVLAFTDESRSEAPRVSGEGTESLAAKRGTESPAIGNS